MTIVKITLAAFSLLLASGCASTAIEGAPILAPGISYGFAAPRQVEPSLEELTTGGRTLGFEARELPSKTVAERPKVLFASRFVSRARKTDCPLCRGAIK